MRTDRRAKSSRLILSWLCATGCAIGVAASSCSARLAANAAKNETRISGRVVDIRGRPLGGRLVASRGSTATTDAEGRFTLPASTPCDLTIVAPDKSRATIYRGVSRLDPRLVEFADAYASATPAHSAKIDGTLSIVGSSSLRNSPIVVAFTSADGYAYGGSSGTSYGPLVVSWDGPTTIDGQVFALAIDRPPPSMRPPVGADAGTPSFPAWFAHRTIRLTDGQPATVDLALEHVPNVRRPPGSIVPQSRLVPVGFEEEYRSKQSGRLFAVGGSLAPGDEHEVPDLRPFGLVPCVIADGHSPYLNARAMRCGAPLEEPASLALPDTPAFSTPVSKTPAQVGLAFAWSPVARAVYRLTLRPTTRRLGASKYPVIQIYTSAAADAWPDLQSVGLAFPQPRVAYEALIAALGPYGSIDDAVGPDGVAALAPPESWRSESYPISVPILPPLGAEEAACHYEEAQVIVCGPPPRPGTPSEWYQISAMNNLIRYHPEFAKAIGIHCVLDCATARAYMKAYARYAAAHPGFDEHTPIEVGPPPPPPPVP